MSLQSKSLAALADVVTSLFPVTAPERKKNNWTITIHQDAADLCLPCLSVVFSHARFNQKMRKLKSKQQQQQTNRLEVFLEHRM